MKDIWWGNLSDFLKIKGSLKILPGNLTRNLNFKRKVRNIAENIILVIETNIYWRSTLSSDSRPDHFGRIDDLLIYTHVTLSILSEILRSIFLIRANLFFFAFSLTILRIRSICFLLPNINTRSTLLLNKNDTINRHLKILCFFSV